MIDVDISEKDNILLRELIRHKNLIIKTHSKPLKVCLTKYQLYQRYWNRHRHLLPTLTGNQLYRHVINTENTRHLPTSTVMFIKKPSSSSIQKPVTSNAANNTGNAVTRQQVALAVEQALSLNGAAVPVETSASTLSPSTQQSGDGGHGVTSESSWHS
ncbi:unnamed protein product [Acanthoscelides obtectus]|uniref:Uncharacterized protein n=1 Tax=Acanthoscelides obtectus TaxID=200917 RepID=A0A9P0L9K1_ACAOB|nr:unnamed protein product [Acanthoscelides obtectus]CAK1638899.1 hypothetical protein AOBTE_LOCUS10874 [Acanthoscelides obtectus]